MCSCICGHDFFYVCGHSPHYGHDCDGHLDDPDGDGPNIETEEFDDPRMGRQKYIFNDVGRPTCEHIELERFPYLGLCSGACGDWLSPRLQPPHVSLNCRLGFCDYCLATRRLVQREQREEQLAEEEVEQSWS